MENKEMIKTDQDKKGMLMDIKEQYHIYNYSKTGQIIDEQKINEYYKLSEIDTNEHTDKYVLSERQGRTNINTELKSIWVNA
jgi:hypothetical protein